MTVRFTFVTGGWLAVRCGCGAAVVTAGKSGSGNIDCGELEFTNLCVCVHSEHSLPPPLHRLKSKYVHSIILLMYHPIPASCAEARRALRLLHRYVNLK